jgi:hypothetical protein
MSHRFGVVLRSMKSSPPWMTYATTASVRRAKTMSHHMMRSRYRFAMGNSRNVRNSTMATCTGRSTCVGTIE